ncbi:hypothetical protein B0A48_11094 [Cryoendolithus antarcticus]|uniref:F-box domain-containing protein n=1 Tax=Cryoendolithus antarcticus TaxID=1507870 RepID=A0A1V8SUU5_9PEZI|nr:hypothetical protein B0A48_11094 [Cryoendolithus antarcticus]
MACTLSPDVLVLIFKHLSVELDYESLCNLGLTCRKWRLLSLPCLLERVDVSSHNNGRQPQFEDPDFYPVIYADHSWEYRQLNLIARQRAFIRLLTIRPQLATYVQSLTWTLIWLNVVGDVGLEEIEDEDDGLTEIDRRTWEVLSLLTNVKYLDLASLHEIWEETYVRQNPTILFPAVIDLRLLGWMHRGLVGAIFRSLDVRNLARLRLDYLNDEGALLDQTPMSSSLNHEFISYTRRTKGALDHRAQDLIAQDLCERQTSGEAFIYPGPMWYPLHLLVATTSALSSLTYLQVKIPPINPSIDARSYLTIFRATAGVLLKVSPRLQTLVITLGEHASVYTEKYSDCATSRSRERNENRPWYIKAAAMFLRQIVEALDTGSFPHLTSLRLEGFHVIELANEKEAVNAQLDELWRLIETCRFYSSERAFTKLSSIDHRRVYCGHNKGKANTVAFDDLVRRS